MWKGLIEIFKMSAGAKKITAIIIIIFFLLAFVAPFLFTMLTEAAPLSERQKNMQKIQNEINEEKKLQKNILSEKKEADERIDAIKSNMASLQEELDIHSAKLAQLEKELAEAAAAANQQYEAFKKRIRIMYEQGYDNYLDVLLSSASITDFLNRFEIIKQITEYDNNRLEKLRDARNKIDDAARLVETEKKTKETKMTVYKSEQSKLNKEQSKRDALLDESKLTVAELEKRYKEQDALDKAEKAAAASKMSKNTKFTGGAMEWPTPGYYNITSPFGSRYHPVLKKERMHYGIDIGASRGVSVVAANDGTVIVARYSSSYGNYVMVDHGGGVATLYAHGSGIVVSEGQKVKRGEKLMNVDSTGISTGPHLHYEVIVNGSNVNPSSYY